MGQNLGLRPDASVGAGLEAFARDILHEAREALDNSDLSDAVAVHDLRKALKRWRALLRLLEPLVGPEAQRLRCEARDLARELGAARDSQSALDAFDDLEQGEAFPALPARSRATIRARLEARRAAAETIALTKAMRSRIRLMLDGTGRTITRWPLSEAEFAQIADALAEGYARVRRAIPDVWSEADDEILHELRQRVVVHRYQMPIVAGLWPRFGRLWVAEAQRLREQLGANQDLAVLAALTEPHQPLSHWRARLIPLIATRKSAHVAAAARLAARLFAERPRAFRCRLEALWSGAQQEAS